MDDRGSVWTLLIGLLAGGVVGAVVAFLLAPQSGAETREQIREKGAELGNRVAEVYARAETEAESALGDLRTTIDKLATQVDEMIAQGKARLQGDEQSLAPAYVPEEESAVRVSI